MKKIKIAALLLALCMIISVFAGCGSDSKAVITFRDTSITEKEFCYMLSSYKAIYLYSYFGLSADNAEVWKQMMTDQISVGNYLGALAISNIMSIAVYVDLFDEYGLTLTTEQLNSVEAEINTHITQLGSKDALNRALSVYGCDIDTMRSVLTNSLKVGVLQDYLYGENGKEAATDEEIEKYYTDNYMRCKFILIHKAQDYVYDENGEAVYDSETEKYVTREMTEDEIAAKKALYEDLKARIIDGGEDFDSLVYDYTMESGMHKFTDGYYISSASTFVPAELRTLVNGMESGDVDVLETDSGWYIVKRYDLIEGAWKDENNSAMFGSLESTVNTVKMGELVTPYAEQLVVDTATIEKYPIANMTPNFEY